MNSVLVPGATPGLTAVEFTGAPGAFTQETEGVVKVNVGSGGSAPNFTTGRPTGATAATVEVDAPAITQTGTGVVSIEASLCGTDANAGDTIHAVIARDGQVLLQEDWPVGSDAANTWGVSLSYLDTLPDGNPHTYKLSVSSNGAHNLTTTTNHGYISVLEK